MSNRIAGPFCILPFEVVDKLSEIPLQSRWLYISLLKSEFIDKDWDEAWVTGFIRASKADVIRSSGISKRTFYRNAWQNLVGSRLVEDVQRGFIKLLMVAKKSDARSGRMAGPFRVLPFEILDKLSKTSLQSRWLYISLLRGYFIQENWGEDGSWVTGLIRASKADIIRSSGISRRSFYRDAWQNLVDLGLVEDVQGGLIKLLMVKKKEEQAEPGSVKWINGWLCEMWHPWRPRRKDYERIAYLAEYPVDQLEEALSAAKAARIGRGMFDWITNRLENPKLYGVGAARGSAGENSSGLAEMKTPVAGKMTVDENRSAITPLTSGIVAQNSGKLPPDHHYYNRDLDHDIDTEEEEDTSHIVNNKARTLPKTTTYEWVKEMVQATWPGYDVSISGYGKIFAVEYICNFSPATVQEAFEVAKEQRVKYGDFCWIISWLQEREEVPEF